MTRSSRRLPSALMGFGSMTGVGVGTKQRGTKYRRGPSARARAMLKHSVLHPIRRAYA